MTTNTPTTPPDTQAADAAGIVAFPQHETTPPPRTIEDIIESATGFPAVLLERSFGAHVWERQNI